jgi:tetratricopeptide (TPR) repeat protein
VNSDADIQKALDAVVLYRVDSEKGEGKDLAKAYGIRAYPTFVMTNSNGQPIDLWLGYSKGVFIKTLSQATMDPATIDEKKARFENQPDLHSALTLARYSSSNRQFKDAVAYYMQAEVLKADSLSDYTYDIFDNVSDGFAKEVFSYDDLSKAGDAALAAKANDSETRIDVARRMAYAASEGGRSDEVARYLQKGLDLVSNSDDPTLKEKRAELMVDYSLMVKHDTATAMEYKRASMPEDWMEDAGQLNNFAWWCFENQVNLDEAEGLSRKSVELAKPGREKAMNLDTLAEIVNAKGRTREALELSRKSAKEDPSDQYFQKQVERFEKDLSGKQ